MGDVDRQIGVVLEALRESGLDQDTVVIFTSDHGDHDGEHRLTMKRSFYEAAVHVPLIVRWPGHVASQRVDDTHLINNCIDLLPTLCELAGVAPPAGLPGPQLQRFGAGRGAARVAGLRGERNGGRQDVAQRPLQVLRLPPRGGLGGAALRPAGGSYGNGESGRFARRTGPW